MVDFRKKLNKAEIEKKVNPIDIYKNLDRKSITGPLRPAQENILINWFEKFREKKDLIIKLHTGEGKTLIGLLILQSKLNSNNGPCLYICPNIYLVDQVCEEAKKFGIAYCTIGKENELPNEFLQGKKILITHAQKLFNGKSIFGIDNKFTSVGCIILDDSHACIDSIRSSFSITIRKDNNEELYNKFLNLFEEDLCEQGEGSYLDIKEESYDTMLPIPYWSWNEKKTSVLKLISLYREEKSVKFAWPLIKDSIENCQAFITGNKIEITPYFVPIRSFGTFNFASQRILMSATTQDDSFFIKGLNFNIESVKEPLMNTIQKWSGEKMILIPSIIDDLCDRTEIINCFAVERKTSFGIVSLVSSSNRTNLYKKLGSIVAVSKNIFDEITKLKSGNFGKTLVINNRYDGIDLPDESCRILIIDSMPFFDSLNDRYEEQCRPNSEVINKKLAQKIEQGLGRSVRGEKDYSAILIIGSDLVKFIKGVNTNKFFSPQTRKQIEIGLEIAEMAKDEQKENESPLKAIISLIKQCLSRDDGWKEYYSVEMDKIPNNNNNLNSQIYDVLLLEREAEESYISGDFEKAYSKMQRFIDSQIKNELEKGWYLQLLARYKYPISKIESNKIQKSAFKLNPQLLKPKDGISYQKINYINESRLRRTKNWLATFENYDELMININSILDNLSFGIDSEKFETALKDVGELLGFVSQRPDNLIRKGPDNLWCGVDNKYFMFECKSEVEENRNEITKHEAGQMNNHCAWFESEYGDSKVKRILIIPTKNLSYYADFTHEIEIMRRGKLKLLKDNIKSFIKELKQYNIKEISDIKMQELVNFHKLDISSLETLYTEPYYKKIK
ncbi:DEAD/DEAH box helicase family protein [Clostridium pasteurianum]|uniref:DEAD/DEAH box helicase n=1 Tax=Clostridium pasteurianum TaxID=1501 RepID=UPI0022609817|nr:DEAD/DEAH box helicase [Clostridium pasteurianum]UZW12828.1 DEAD/DEAH box helicase family protein [Clostridium pasteurianum]